MQRIENEQNANNTIKHLLSDRARETPKMVA
jgi:hypothetical protein